MAKIVRITYVWIYITLCVQSLQQKLEAQPLFIISQTEICILVLDIAMPLSVYIYKYGIFCFEYKLKILFNTNDYTFIIYHFIQK